MDVVGRRVVVGTLGTEYVLGKVGREVPDAAVYMDETKTTSSEKEKEKKKERRWNVKEGRDRRKRRGREQEERHSTP
jgi:hypothetical protein